MIILVPVAFIAGIIVSIIFLLAGVFILNTIAIQLIFFLNIATILGRLLYKSEPSSNQIIPFGLPQYPFQQGLFPPQFFPQTSQQLPFSPFLNSQLLPSYQPNDSKSSASASASSSDKMANLANIEMELMELVAMMKNDLNSKNAEESLMSTEEPPMTDTTDNISRQGQSTEEMNHRLMVENNRQRFRPPMIIDTFLRPPRLQ